MEHGWNIDELAPGKIENDRNRVTSPELADEWMYHPISNSITENEVGILTGEVNLFLSSLLQPTLAFLIS